MAFSWKKVKGARISQLVNDHLQKSKKRHVDSSLVVETGFPTSLVDLFMKNREKLKKPSKKKRVKSRFAPKNDADITVISQTSISPCISVPPSNSRMHSTFTSHVNEISVLRATKEDVVSCEDLKGGGVARVEVKSAVYAAVLKVFLVVAFALGTNKLALGITLSAFLLFFLEYVRKHACRLLNVCCLCKEGLRSMVRRVILIFGLENERLGLLSLDVLQKESLKPGISCLQSRDEIQETPMVERNEILVSRVEEIQSVMEMIDESGRDATSVCDSMVVVKDDEPRQGGISTCDSKKGMKKNGVSIREIMELERKKSGRSKMKSNIVKKLVPKKFRSKKRNNCGDAKIPPIREDNIDICEEETVDQQKDEKGSETDSKVSSSSSVSPEERDCACITVTEEKTEAGKNSSHLVLCLMVVLIGLIGGRTIAMLLTFFWCLLLKSGEMIQSCIKVPMIRSLQ